MGAVINKKIKQFYYNNSTTIPVSTKNIFEGYVVYSLAIHAIPGTKFSIDGTTIFSIGPTGNYALDCSDAPLTSLYLKQAIRHSEQLMYPIIIDIEYMGVSTNG